MEPPSLELATALACIGVSRRDLLRCRRLVARYSRGLTVTDSLWLDALLRKGKLSRLQLQLLESRQVERLRVEDQLVLQDLQHLDPVLCLYRAKDMESGGAWSASLLRRPDHEIAETSARLKAMLGTSPTQNRSVPFAAQRVLPANDGVWILSPAVSGQSLAAMILRRGRFPEALVRTIALSLGQQLAGNLHGDVRLSNVWLTNRGECALLHGGVLAAAIPTYSIHSPLPLDAYETVAPERWGSVATPAGDLYALGCLLWHLLSGRPPHLNADPIAKTWEHQTRRIPDIRSLAPETSESLAVLVRNLTAREPQRRPQNAEEVIEQLQRGPRRLRPVRAQSHLRHFSETFHRPARRERTRLARRSNGSHRWALAAGLTLVCGFVAWNRDSLGLPSLSRVEATTHQRKDVVRQAAPLHSAPASLDVPKENLAAETPSSKPENAAVPLTTEIKTAALPTVSTSSAVEQTPANATSETPIGDSSRALPSEPIPWPKSDKNGQVRLQEGRTYRPASIRGAGRLLIQCDGKLPATILVEAALTQFEATQVSFENIRFEVAPTSKAEASDGSSAITIRSQELILERCTFRSTPETRPDTDSLIQWSAIDPAAEDAGRLLMIDAVVDWPVTFLAVDVPLSAAYLDNTFVTGGGPLLRLEQGLRSGMTTSLNINQSTFFESGPLVAMAFPVPNSGTGQLSIQAANTLYDALPSQGFVEFWGAIPDTHEAAAIGIKSAGLIVPPGLTLVGHRAHVNGAFQPVPTAEMTIEGIIIGELKFSNSSDGYPLPVSKALPPSDSGQPWGAQTARLPHWPPPSKWR